MENNKKFIEELDNHVLEKNVCGGDYVDVYEKIDLGAKLKYQYIINNYFKKGVKQPLKKLLADINSTGGKDTLNLNFLCYLPCYYAYMCSMKSTENLKYVDLPDENKVCFERGEDVGMDFATAFEFYKILKLKNLDYEADRKKYYETRKKITKMFDQFYDFGTEIRKTVYDFYLEMISCNNCVLDYDLMDFIDLIIGGDISSFLKDENQIKDIFSDDYIGENKKIDFKFLRLATENINRDVIKKNKAVKKQLIKYFDNKMSISQFNSYLSEKGFIDPEVIPAEQIKEIIENLELEKDENGQILKIQYSTFLKHEADLEKYNDGQLIKMIKAKCKNNVQADSSYYETLKEQEREIISDPELSDIEYAKEIIENRIENDNKDGNQKIKYADYRKLEESILSRNDDDGQLIKITKAKCKNNLAPDNGSYKCDDGNNYSGLQIIISDPELSDIEYVKKLLENGNKIMKYYDYTSLKESIAKRNDLDDDVISFLSKIKNNSVGKRSEYFEEYREKELDQAIIKNNPGLNISISNTDVDNNNKENLDQQNIDEVKNDAENKMDNKKDPSDKNKGEDHLEKLNQALKCINEFFEFWDGVKDYDANNKTMVELKNKLKSFLTSEDICLSFIKVLAQRLKDVSNELEKKDKIDDEYVKKLKAKLNYALDVFELSDAIQKGIAEKANVNFSLAGYREKVNNVDVDIFKSRKAILEIVKTLFLCVSLICFYWGVKKAINLKANLIKNGVSDCLNNLEVNMLKNALKKNQNDNFIILKKNDIRF